MKLKSIKKLVLILILIIFAINITNIIKFVFPIKHKSYIIEYSKKYNLDVYWVLSVIKTESNFKQDAVSSKDAQGLMQLTPETAEWIAETMGMKDFNLDMLKNPEVNIKMGCWYLNDLKTEFKNNIDLVLAAYNGGRGNVKKWLKNQDHSKDGENLNNIPFKETDKYVKKVRLNYKIYKFLYDR